MEDNEKKEDNLSSLEKKTSLTKEETKNEENSEKKFEKRNQNLKTRFKNLVKDRDTSILIAILAFALILRLYYFFLTKDQALWWDSLCYGSLAKNMITPRWSHINTIMGETSIRPIILPLIWSLFLRMGFPDILSKFFLEFLPSILSVFFIYLVAEKMYNKRVALISAFVLAVSWMHIFYSMRMLTRVPGLFVSLISVYYFFKALETEKISTKYFAISIFLAFIAVLTRWTFGLVGMIYIVHLFVSRKLTFLKQKSFWLGSVIGTIPLLLFFAYNFIKYQNIFPAMGVYAHSASVKTAYAYYTWDFLSHILRPPFYYIFLFGLAVVAIQLILGAGFISKIKKLKSHLFIFLLLILNLVFLIFYIQQSEDRYLFECFLSIVLIVAIGVDYIYVAARKYHKQMAFILLIVLLFIGGYYQLQFGDQMTRSKSVSFLQMKQAFLWFKDAVPDDAVILGEGLEPYVIYYSGKMPLEFTEEPIRNAILNGTLDFDYVVIHAFSPQSAEFTGYLTSIQQNLTPMNQFFFDPQKQSLAVAFYKYNK